ncbi:unnamed protein product [Effrenium voratum]|nr:unnamed protein product [Effrenium voratum]
MAGTFELATGLESPPLAFLVPLFQLGPWLVLLLIGWALYTIVNPVNDTVPEGRMPGAERVDYPSARSLHIE